MEKFGPVSADDGEIRGNQEGGETLSRGAVSSALCGLEFLCSNEREKKRYDFII